MQTPSTTHYGSVSPLKKINGAGLRLLCEAFALKRILKVDLSPFKKALNVILGLKREDRFFKPFCELVQKTRQVRFSYLLWHGNLCNAPRTLQKFSQKCWKIAGCHRCAVYGSQPPIASKPDSFPPEQSSDLGPV